MITYIQRWARSTGLSILLTFAVPISAHATNGFFARWLQRGSQQQTVRSVPGVPNEINSLPAEMRRLPLGIQAWFVYETDYLSRAVDPAKIMSPTQNDQDPFYAPEGKNVFNLTAESIDLYKDILNRALAQETFRAVATASSRSLLVWSQGTNQNHLLQKSVLIKQSAM